MSNIPGVIVPGVDIPGVRMGFTTRALGNVAVHSYRHDAAEQHAAHARMAALAERLGTQPMDVLAQVHGHDVAHLPRDDYFPADAAITQTPGVVCAVLTADCVPILLAGADNAATRWVAAIHAGWRGLAGGVIEATLAKLPNHGSGAVAVIGPAISAAHYEVGQKVLEAIPHIVHDGRYVNLAATAAAILAANGITQTHQTGLCSYADDRFYSYRAHDLYDRGASFIYMTD